MKRQELDGVIKKHINNIEKYSDRIPGSFQQEDIHDLRVEYKKVRAFLRLLQFETSAGDLQIPLKLKAVYQAAGKVRDWQLFLSVISQVDAFPLLPALNTCWQHGLFAQKEQLVQEIEQAHFKKILDAVKEELPGRLQSDTIRKFIHQKVASIHILLLAAENEKDLHSIRKHLKDIIYNVKIVEHDLGISFPAVAWASEKQLNDLATRLGDFNDRCIALSLLQSGCSHEMVGKEKAIITELQTHWLQQKEEQEQQLLQQVQQFQLVHAF